MPAGADQSSVAFLETVAMCLGGLMLTEEDSELPIEGDRTLMIHCQGNKLKECHTNHLLHPSFLTLDTSNIQQARSYFLPCADCSPVQLSPFGLVRVVFPTILCSLWYA
jgi:hypothetical protein